MIRINLLPKDKIKKKVIPLKGIYFGLLVLAALGIIASFAWLTYQKKTYHQQIAKLEKEISKYRIVEKKIKEIEKSKKEATLRLKILSRLLKNSPKMIKNVSITVQKIPYKQLYFTEYDYKDKEITIKGNAIDLETVAHYIDNLEKTQEFSRVDLEGTNIKKVKDYKLTTFSIKILPK